MPKALFLSSDHDRSPTFFVFEKKLELILSLNQCLQRIDQTAAHVILECPLHRAPREYHGMLVQDDESR